jgi:TolA-binding protein
MLQRIITSSLLLLALAGAAAGQPSTAEQQQFVFAHSLYLRGDLSNSAEAFDKYLDNFTKGERRGDALYFRALIANQQGQRDKAAALLENVPPLKAVPPHRLPLLRGRNDVERGKPDLALKWLEPIALDGIDAAEKSFVLYYRGLAYHGTKNYTGAAEQFTAASQLPSSLKDRCLLELGRSQALLNKADDAIKSLEQCLALGNSSVAAEAARLAGDLSYDKGDYEKAIKLYGNVLSNHQTSPHFAPCVIKTLWAQLNARSYNQVAGTFEQYKAKVAVADRPAAWFVAGRAQQHLNRHREAIALFDAVAANRTGAAIEDQVLYRLAESQFELSEFDAMTATLARLAKDHPGSSFNASGDFLLAQADLKRARPTEAAARLTTIIARGAEHPYYATALLERARLYVAAGQLEPAAGDYQAYVKLAEQPGSRITGLSETLAKLTDIYYRLGKLKEAGELTQRLLATADLPPLIEQEAMYRQALVLIQSEKFSDGGAMLESLAKKHPQNAYNGQIRYYRSLLLLGDNKPDDAIKELQAAVGDATLPADLKANALLLISMRQREREQLDDAAGTLGELEKVITLDRMRDLDLIWLGRYYVAKDPRVVFKYVTPLIDGKRKVTEPQKTEALFIVGQGLRAIKKLDLAIQSFKEVEALGHGYGLLARLEVARTQAEAGKLSDAIESYRGLMIARDSGVASTAMLESAQIQRQLAVNLKAAGDAEGAEKANQEAYQLAFRLTVLYTVPELSPVPELAHLERAELAGILGKSEDVAASLKELRERFPEGPYALYGAALQLIEKKDTTEAATLLRKLRQQKLDGRLAARVHAKLLALEGKAP